MVQIGQIVVHLTTQPLPVLLIIWCPCTPYMGRNYGTNRSDCHTSHNTASASLAYYQVPLYTIQGRKLVNTAYISQYRGRNYASASLAYYLVPLYTIQGTKTMVQIGQIVIHLTIHLAYYLVLYTTGEKTMVQIGQIVVHLTTQPLPVLLIIWCPCTPYRGRNYGTNRSDCHITSHNRGRNYSLCQSCLLSGAPVHHTGDETMVQIGHCRTSHNLPVLAYYHGDPVHHTGDYGTNRSDCRTSHNTASASLAYISGAPCTPYRGENYGTNRSDCRTYHNTASAVLLNIWCSIIQGTKLWYK